MTFDPAAQFGKNEDPELSERSHAHWVALVDEAHETARTTMEEQGYNNFTPMAIFLTTTGVIPVIMGGVGAGQMRDAVTQSYRFVAEFGLERDEQFLILGVIIHGDAVVKKVPGKGGAKESPVDEEGNYVPGNYQKAFEEGDTSIQETLFTVAMGATEKNYSIFQCYRYHPVDGFEWDEPDIYDGYVDGTAVDQRWDFYSIAKEAMT